jgi:hypothetical protein
LETEKAHLYISFLGIEPADALSSGQLIKKNMQMGERLVDILNGDGAVVHTFPITLSGSDTVSDIDYQTKALEAAAHAQLVRLRSYHRGRHMSRQFGLGVVQ